MAIVFACGHPGLELCAVTTVAGNIGLLQTTANALSVLEFAGCPHVPVAAGSAAPLLRPGVHARQVHGESGLGQAQLPPPKTRPLDQAATDLMIDTIGSSPGEITLVATGPLTNIALAVRRQPTIVRQVADFVIMGGSATRGNVTPAAEFNIVTDPEAAAIVFGAGWRVTMIGLHVTLQVEAGSGVRKRMDSLGRLASRLLQPGLRGYRGAQTTPAELLPGPPGRSGLPVDGGHDGHRFLCLPGGPQRARRHLGGRGPLLGYGLRRLGPRASGAVGRLTRYLARTPSSQAENKAPALSELCSQARSVPATKESVRSRPSGGSEFACQDATIGWVASGWNWTPACGPIVNACRHTSLAASSAAPGGSSNASRCHDGHGPSARSGCLLVTRTQPISGASSRYRRAPSTLASTCAPKQMPSTGTPAVSRRATYASSPASQGTVSS